MSRSFGIVVVGVGIAGSVRIRDLLQDAAKHTNSFLPGVSLIGYVSRREVAVEGAERLLNLEAALSRSDVNAVIVCTENEQHEDIARKAILAKKHVLVEFPLARSADKAKELMDLAQQNGVLCYEEDIGLLTQSHQAMTVLAKDPGLVTGTQTLEGRPSRWNSNITASGSPFHVSISMIHRALDLLGDVKVTEATLKSGADNSFVATGTLTSPDKGSVQLSIARDPNGPPRKTEFSWQLKDGSSVDEKNILARVPQETDNNTPKPGLFLEDLILFVQTVEGGRPEEWRHQQWLTVRGLQVADQLYAACQTAAL